MASRLLAVTATLAVGAARASECATAWVQCGGAGYGGPTCCDEGYSCTTVNAYYSQCTPSSAKMPRPAPAPAPEPRDPQAPVEEECYSLYSNVLFNNLLQSFPRNPDSNATGYIFCTLCTSGAMSCQANVHGGLTPLIASHIHVADNGDGVNGTGPPVINFCGTNEQYGILDMPGAPYPEPCAPYVKGAALMASMTGKFVEGAQNAAFSVATRVKDIAASPRKYYFNFHSIASWTYWQLQGQGPVGMCRGQMAASRRLAAADSPVGQPVHV